MPGATVTATNTATGVKMMASTNSSGVYNFSFIQPGNYKVAVEMPGFQTTTKTDVHRELGSRARLNLETAVAGVALADFYPFAAVLY
jgi:hypothetical protein